MPGVDGGRKPGSYEASRRALHRVAHVATITNIEVVQRQQVIDLEDCVSGSRRSRRKQ